MNLTAARATLVRFGPAIGVAAAALFVLLAHRDTLDHDSAMYMDSASRLLRGARPYIDLVEVNPPLAWIVYVFPEVVAELLGPLGLGVAPCFHLSIAAFVTLGMVGSWRFVEPRARPSFATALLLVQLLALSVPFRPWWLDHWASFPLAAWGQREHLFVTTATVWLALRAARDRGEVPDQRWALAAGVLTGGLGALKPHFLVLIAAVEAVSVVAGHRRSGEAGASLRAAFERAVRTPEVQGLLVVPAIYALSFVVWPSEWKAAMFGRWLPLIARTYGAAYGATPRQMALHMLPAIVLVAAAFMGFFAARRADGAGPGASRDPLAVRMLAFGGFGLAIAIVQMKGFAYHVLPAEAGAVLTLGLVTPSFAGRGRMAAGALGAMSLLAAVFCLALPVEPLGAAFTKPLDRALTAAALPPGARVLVLADAVLGPFPLLRVRGFSQTGRFPWTFPVALAENLPPGEREVESARIAADIAEDLARDPPRAIFALAEPMQALPPGFDFKQWLERHDATRAALSAYSEPMRAGPWWVYRRAAR